MATHYLKTIQPFFSDVRREVKTFELRLNDRDYKVGDILVLQEFIDGEYTGEEEVRCVPYILFGGKYGLDAEHCIMCLEKI